MSPLRLTIFSFGLVFILIGSCFILFGAHSQNSLANITGAIFTISGTLTNYLQLFFHFPLFRPESLPGGKDELPKSPAPAKSSAPASSSTTFFRLSGTVLIIGGVISAAIGLLPNSVYDQASVTRALDLLATLSLLLLSLGLPALQMKQSSRTRWLGRSGVGLLCSSYILYAISSFLYGSSLYQVNNSFYNFANLLQVIGSILLGISIIRASTFPHWTGVVLIISGIVFIVSFVPFSSSLPVTSYYFAYNVASILSTVAFIRCGNALIRQRI